jgi:hypothetical protein
MVAQPLEDAVFVVEIAQRPVSYVPHNDGHSAAGEKVSVGQQGNQPIPRGAVVWAATSDKKLKRSAEDDFGPAETALRLGPGIIHDMEELARLCDAEELFAQRGGSAPRNESVGPHAIHAQFAAQARYFGELPVVAALGSERDDGRHAHAHKMLQSGDGLHERSLRA